MRIFIYGFKPFGNYPTNITEEIIQSLPPQSGVKTKVFKVVFDESQFVDAIDRFHPNVVIGLGQCPRGRKLRIERRAVNKKGDHKGAPISVIHAHGPSTVCATLPIAPSQVSRPSYDAGNYVCNFSMYVIGRHLQKTDVRFVFIHIPRGYDPKQALRFLESTIKSTLALEEWCASISL